MSQKAVDRVRDWGRKYEITEYELEIIISNGFDSLQSIAYISETDLDALGIQNIASRKKILWAAKEIINKIELLKTSGQSVANINNTIYSASKSDAPPEGVYRIVNITSNTSLDLENGSSENGIIVQGWASAPGEWDQYWVVKKTSSGSYRFYNRKSGTYLDMRYGLSENGTQVQCWSYSETDSQLWQFVAANNGYRLKNVGSNTYIDLSNGSSTNGTKVQGWEYADSSNQIWAFYAVDLKPVDISRIVSMRLGTGIALYNPDATMLPNDIDTMQQVWTDSIQNKYNQSSDFDCDSFALVMKSSMAILGYGSTQRSCGLVWGLNSSNGTTHAFNWFIDLYWNLNFFEPQTGTLVTDHPYTVTTLVMGM